jgi:RNA polymerase sigma-B factor
MWKYPKTAPTIHRFVNGSQNTLEFLFEGMEIVSTARRNRSRKQVTDLQRAYYEAGNLAAREQLIEEYLPLVRSLARRFANRGERLEDLVQVGSIGLIKAVDRFEPDRGVNLAAFAVPNILGEMRRHLRDRSALIRIPRRQQEAVARLRQTRGQLAARLQRNPTSGELAAAARLDESELADACRVEEAHAQQSLADHSAPQVSAEDVFRLSEDRVALSTSLRRLHRLERHAVRCRFFADMSQLEIADRLGISQAQASRLLASGLAKLRADLAGNADFSGSGELNSRHGDSRRRHGRAA